MNKKIIVLAASAVVAIAVFSQIMETKRPQGKPTEKVIDKVTNNQVKNNKEDQQMKVTELTAELFKSKVMDYEKHPQEWIFAGDKPAVIDFYATWCGPCKATAPIVDALAVTYAGKVDFYKVDVDKQQEIAALFGIRSIPSLLFVPMSGKPQMQVGAMDRSQFDQAIQDFLLK